MRAEDLVKKLGKAEKSGDEWKAQCPVPGHGKGRGDLNPSLSIRDGDNGMPILYCHGGCSQDDLLSVLKYRGWWPEREPLPPQQKSKKLNPIIPVPIDAPEPDFLHKSRGHPSVVYTYQSNVGDVLFYTARFDKPDGKKVILPYTWQGKPDGTGKWDWKSPGTPRPLFGLEQPLLTMSDSLIIGEGEKAALAIRQLLSSYPSLTSQGGGSAAGKSNWSIVVGKIVIIWPDADDAGAKYARIVARLCLEAGAKEVRIITPPMDVPESWDAADAVEDGWTTSQVEELIRNAKPYDTLEDVSDWEDPDLSILEIEDLPPPTFPIGIFGPAGEILIAAAEGTVKIGRAHV